MFVTIWNEVEEQSWRQRVYNIVNYYDFVGIAVYFAG